MKELTSINNPLVKFISSLSQKKFRTENNLFLVEGEKALDGALNCGYKVKYVFTLNKNLKILNKIKTDEVYFVNEKVMKKISTTDGCPEILSVIEKQIFFPEKNISRVILLENIKDCGNLGTIIRSACAFNIEAVILLGDCCDLYSSKTLRSSVGTFFQMKFFEYKTVSQIKTDFADYKLISTNLHKKSDISLNEINDKFILMFGSEADGLTSDTTKIADNNFILPLKSSVESLNLATAVSIILYELNK